VSLIEDASVPPRRISERATLVVLLVVFLVWNLTGNLVLPGVVYVPANLAVSAGIVALGRHAGASWSDLGLDPARVRSGLILGCIAAAVVGVVLAFAVLVPSLASFFENDAVSADSTFDHWFTPTIRIPFGTVVFEELLFRSVLLALLMRMRGIRFAVIGSSIVFGLWHIVPAWEGANGGVVQVVGAIIGTVAITTVAGLLFALLRVRSGSVIAPTLAHAATNSFAYLAAIVVATR
jgi:membrane protease YdiL (CAAX protease family)